MLFHSRVKRNKGHKIPKHIQSESDQKQSLAGCVSTYKEFDSVVLTDPRTGVQKVKKK